MKKAIVTLALFLALVGFGGLSGAMAATANPWRAPACTAAYANYIGAPGSCPVVHTVAPAVPGYIGGVGY